MKAIDKLIEKYEGFGILPFTGVVIQDLEALKEQLKSEHDKKINNLLKSHAEWMTLAVDRKAEIEQLKEQHKEDVMNAHYDGSGLVDQGQDMKMHSEQYYQQTHEQ